MSSQMGMIIRNQRHRLGLTQEELGAKVGTTKATINKYETGVVVNIKRPMLEKLAAALELSPSYLMGWADDDRPQQDTPQELSEEETELMRIYRGLSVKDRISLLKYAYDLEDKK